MIRARPLLLTLLHLLLGCSATGCQRLAPYAPPDGRMATDGEVTSDSALDASSHDANRPPADATTSDAISRTDAATDSTSGDSTTATGRVGGAIVLFRFDEGTGTTVHDQSQNGAAYDLTIVDPAGAAPGSRISWQPGRLVITNDVRLVNPASIDKLITACKASNEITVEAWVAADIALQGGPARVVTISDNKDDHNLLLGQGNCANQGGLLTSSYCVRTRTTLTDAVGRPPLDLPAGSAKLQPAHVVYTRAAGGTRVAYIDGKQVATDEQAGDFSSWTAEPLVLANETSASRPWRGTYHLLAIYSRALTPAEVSQNFAVGADPEL